MRLMSIGSEICEISLLNGAVRLHVPDGRGLKPTTDAVFLAAACPAKSGDHVLDLGCGVGTVGFCVAARVPGVRIMGVDRESDLVDLAFINAKQNMDPANTEFLIGDIRNCPARLDQPVFDHVVMNPPFYDHGTYIPPDDPLRARALGHHGLGEKDIFEEVRQGSSSQRPASLDDWMMAARALVKSRGTVTMIYHAESIDDILAIAHRRFGGITIIPLWPHAGEPARRVIVRMVKDSYAPAELHPGLVLHEQNGEWTDTARNILINKEEIQ